MLPEKIKMGKLLVTCLIFISMLGCATTPEGGYEFMRHWPFFTIRDKYPALYEYGLDDKYLWKHLEDMEDAGTPKLVYAAKGGRFDLVKYLVEHGYEINQKAANGDTALTAAKREGNDRIVRYLIAHGARE